MNEENKKLIKIPYNGGVITARPEGEYMQGKEKIVYETGVVITAGRKEITLQKDGVMAIVEAFIENVDGFQDFVNNMPSKQRNNNRSGV